MRTAPPTRGTPDQGEALPMTFRLYDANSAILFEGRCGDIDADWWHGFEPLNYLAVPLPSPVLSTRRHGRAVALASAIANDTGGKHRRRRSPRDRRLARARRPVPENRARRAPPGSPEESVSDGHRFVKYRR